MTTPSIHSIQHGEVQIGEYDFEGWVKTHRRSKNVSFIELTDGTTVRGLQLVIAPETPGYPEIAESLATGASIQVTGTLVESPARGQKFELQATNIVLIGDCSAEDYPLQKKGHTLEFLRENLHLRPRSNTFGAVFRVRSAASAAVHRFFEEKGFLWVHTPIITASDCEGAGEMFQVTMLDPHSPPIENGRIDYSQDFFGEKTSLTVSGQLEGEIFACALKNIYTFGPTFRAENSNTTRHLAEFWMIEPEMAFCNLQGDMNIAEEFTRYVIAEVLENCRPDLEFLWAREWAPKGLEETLEQVVKAETFAVLDYSEAIDILQKSGKKFDFPVEHGMDLQSEHERFLTDEHVKGPAFVINYPREIKAFYMRLNEDEKTVAAMDLLVPRLGEVIGGSQREERKDVLESRIQEAELPVEDYWWYLNLREYGSVPHAGFGLGFERLLLYITGMQNIRDVIPFPRYPGHARF
jgi:asparaginyl-tRNA synthetase